jgi:tRNA U34 5-methylaminomethyl-2-thiouridine-forming methyltransferase MnmC
MLLTEDGSTTLYNEIIGEHYHSTHGAIQESQFIFIKDGLNECKKDEIHILEMGFGTGLNAFLTMLEAEKTGKKIHYHTVELYPISVEQAKTLNFAQILAPEKNEDFLKLHTSKWGEISKISTNFEMLKIQGDFNSLDFNELRFDVVYYDAFSPEKQPELWSLEIFEKIFSHCNKEAILTTYCAKGYVRRNLQAAGFTVHRLPGPPGKREKLSAVKS